MDRWRASWTNHVEVFTQAWEGRGSHQSGRHLHASPWPQRPWIGQRAAVPGVEPPDPWHHPAGPLHPGQGQSLRQWWAAQTWDHAPSLALRGLAVCSGCVDSDLGFMVSSFLKRKHIYLCLCWAFSSWVERGLLSSWGFSLQWLLLL